LREHLLRLRLLRGDAPRIGVRRRNGTKRDNADEEKLRLSFPATEHQQRRSESDGTVPEGAGPHKFGTLAAVSDVCNRFPSQNLLLPRMYRLGTKVGVFGGFTAESASKYPLL
jgi:hypothetical protein